MNYNVTIHKKHQPERARVQKKVSLREPLTTIRVRRKIIWCSIAELSSDFSLKIILFKKDSILWQT